MSSDIAHFNDTSVPYRSCFRYHPNLRCLGVINQRLEDIEAGADNVEEVLEAIREQCCDSAELQIRMCHFPPVDDFNTISSFPAGSEVQWHIPYVGVQPEAGGPWIQLNSTAFSSGIFNPGDFVQVAGAGSNLTIQYMNFVATSLSAVGGFYNLSASTEVSPTGTSGRQDLVIGSNGAALNNFVIVIYRDTRLEPGDTFFRTHYTYTLNGDAAFPPGAVAGAQMWTLGGGFTVIGVTSLPFPLFPITSATPADPLFWSDFTESDTGAPMSVTSFPGFNPGFYFADSCNVSSNAP